MQSRNCNKKKVENLFSEFWNFIDGLEEFKTKENKKLSNQFKVFTNQKNESKKYLIKENKRMNIYGYKATLRADGRWVVKPNLNGKQISIYGHDKEELQLKMKFRFLKNERKTALKKQGSFFNWYNDWLNTYKKPNVKESTFKQLKNEFESNNKNLFHYDLADLTPVILQKHLNGIVSSRVKERMHVYIKDCLNKAVLNDMLEKNPMNAVETKKHEKVHWQALEVEEEKLFVATVKTLPNYIPILLCLYQGLRIGESLALTYDDIDFENNTITINKSRHYHVVGETKTKASNRVIPLFNKTKELLKNIQPNKEIYEYSYTQVFKTMEKLKKLEPSLKKFVFHSLRHTFATRCIEDGVHFKTVSKWLGHSSTSMTMEVYTHINKDFEQKQIDIINNKKDT